MDGRVASGLLVHRDDFWPAIFGGWIFPYPNPVSCRISYLGDHFPAGGAANDDRAPADFGNGGHILADGKTIFRNALGELSNNIKRRAEE